LEADVDVVKDVLDKLVVDRNGREMGRVDGLVLAQREGGPPRLAELLIGPSALGYRLHPAIGRWVGAFQSALGIDGSPVRIDFDDVLQIDDGLTVDRSLSETTAAAVEQRLRAWLVKIPGGK
jgi:sporulation protein YlmC with PRC-barrel domain